MRSLLGASDFESEGRAFESLRARHASSSFQNDAYVGAQGSRYPAAARKHLESVGSRDGDQGDARLLGKFHRQRRGR